MTIQPGVRLGPYEILSAIGAGGMGEVYRARDTRLDRTVAIKVLPAALAGDPQVRLRFEREAKAISALAHPHICMLHDVGNENGVAFLVMEHLEGENLAQRIERGPLSIADTVRYGIQIADALDKAHRRGIIHRDLKPGNVMITRSGAKLLDFGLARTIEPEASPESLTIAAPVKAARLTEEGMVVGTFQYMAPEQVQGFLADARTDIFAFGALLYEMLTGRQAFDGMSRASLIAAILTGEPPPVREIQPLVPPALERMIRICLAKDPDDRWQSAHDLRLELESLGTAEPAPAALRKTARMATAGWIAAAVVAAAAIAFVLTRHPPAAHEIRFEIAPPAGGRFNTADAPASLSPDGRRVVVRIAGGAGTDLLYLRTLDAIELQPLRGTEGAYDTFWSPDGRKIAFFASSSLKVLDVPTAAVTTIAPVQDGRGGSWSKGGTILYAPNLVGPLYSIPAGGGTPRQATRLDPARKEIMHWRPSFLPDGRRFLFLVQSAVPANSGVYLGTLDSPEVRRVLDLTTPAVYVEPGYLVYYAQGNVYARPFDPSDGRMRGEGTVLAKNVEYSAPLASAAFSASPNGVLAWHPRGPGEEMALSRFPLDGAAEQPLGTTGTNIDLSRDGSRLALQRFAQNRNSDLWIHDLRRGVSSRVTFDPADETGPVWSPDGKRLAYVVVAAKRYSVRSRLASGANEETLLERDRSIEIVDWSRDGKTLLAEVDTPQNGGDLVTIDWATGTMTGIATTPFQEFAGRFSPDGKWVAYDSNDSGRAEIYVQPFPPDGSKWQVSSGKSQTPRWSEDGRTLYYVADGRTLMSVAVTTTNGFETGSPRKHAVTGSLDYVIRGGEAIVSRHGSIVPMPLIVATEWRPREK